MMDDPQSQGLLSLGLRLMSTPGNFGTAFGQAGIGAMNDMQQAQVLQQRTKQQDQYALMQKLQMDQMLDQQRRLKEADANDAQFRATIQPPLGGMVPGAPATNAAQAESAVGMPGYGASSASPQRAPIDPNQAMLWNALQTKQMTPMQYYQALQKDDTPIPLAEGANLVSKAGKVLASNPKDPTNDPFVKMMIASGINPASPEGRQLLAAKLRKDSTHSPGTTLSVYNDNLGLKPKDRFEMEGKLASDYQGTIKLDNLVLGATSKIKTALSQPGALKDQAAIYSFAKMLDPEGAVREADYAAIANTTGLVDRVRGYAQRMMTGEQLNQTQRGEMLQLMTAFEEVAQKRIKAAQGDFSRQASNYNLRPDAIFSGTAPNATGGGAAPPSRVVPFGELK